MANSKRITVEDLDKRAVIKLNKNIKAVDNGVHGLMIFGEKNDYPQMMELAINGSVTAKAAAGIYSKFLAGKGFKNQAVNNIVVGRDQRGKEITVRSLLRQVTDSCAWHNGFYIHCNRNYEGQTGTVHLKPFKDGRFAKPDDTGFSAKILFYDNWGKDKDIGKYDTKKASSYHIFSNDLKVIQAQINGVEDGKYKGQVYFQFLDNTYFYPLSPFDAAYMDVDTEQQVALFKNRTIRNGFFNKTIIRKQKEYKEQEVTSIDGDQNDPRSERVHDDTVSKDIVDFVGADGETVIVIEDDLDPDTGEFPKNSFQVETIETKVDSKLFDSWEQGLKNNIRMSIRGIPAILIDYEQNQLGTTSGEAIIQATQFYNALTLDDRELISQSFADIFKNSNIPELANNQDWTIEPIKLIDNGTDNTSAATSN